jgi:hypothetical protein
MRSITIFGFSLLALLLVSSQASAWALSVVSQGPVSSLTSSDTVTLDIFLDADAGLTLLSTAITYDDDGELTYNGPASDALLPNTTNCIAPACGVGPGGAQPQYILYTGGKGSTILYPQQTPFWLNWPGVLPPDRLQVNLNFAEPAFGSASATGTGIYIGTLVFDVNATVDGTAPMELCIDCAGNILQEGLTVIPASQIPLTGTPIMVTLPEPAIASLALAGLVTVYLVRRRRA